MCWEMEIRTSPTAVSAVRSSQSSAHSNPHAREGANTLAPCWALGNNSANIPACLLNSRPFAFLKFFFFLLHPALLNITVSALSPTWAVPALSTRALGDHQGICADNRICFANNILSNILESPEQGALREIPEGR